MSDEQALESVRFPHPSPNQARLTRLVSGSDSSSASRTFAICSFPFLARTILLSVPVQGYSYAVDPTWVDHGSSKIAVPPPPTIRIMHGFLWSAASLSPRMAAWCCRVLETAGFSHFLSLKRFCVGFLLRWNSTDCKCPDSASWLGDTASLCLIRRVWTEKTKTGRIRGRRGTRGGGRGGD